MKHKMKAWLQIEPRSFQRGLSCLAILMVCFGGLSSESSAAVLFPAGDRQLAILDPVDADVWDIDDPVGAQTANQPTLLSLSAPPSHLVPALMNPRHDIAAVIWNALFEVDQDVRRFTFTLLLQEQLGNGQIQPPIGAVNLANSAPVTPLAPSPSSVLLFVPALFALLGVVLRERSCIASAESGTESMVERPPSGSSTCLLVLSPDPAFSHEVQEQAHRTGYTIRITTEARDTITISEHASPALLLVDRRAPDWDMLRTSPSLKCVPLITLAPRGSEVTDEQWIADLERGADGAHDFHDGSRLLIAKIVAYLRRAGCAVAQRGVYQVGAVELDSDVHEVKIAGQRLPLSAKPFAILKTLMQAPSKVFSRSELVDRVWGPRFAIGEHTLDVHVHALRRQLDRDPRRLCRLVTIKGVGFKLKAADSVHSSSQEKIEQAAFKPHCGPPQIAQIPLLKHVARRRQAGMPRRTAAVSHPRNAALAG